MRRLSLASVPAARTMLALALVLGLGACRSSLTAPVSPSGDGLTVLPARPLTTPPVTGPLGIRSVSVDPDGKDLVVAIRYTHSLPKTIGYDPFTPGGWCFQVFLDTDPQSSGYLGYDFLTRDTEPDLAGREIRVRRTIGGGEANPGGWGDPVDVVPLLGGDARLVFRIPLSALDGDDGLADYRVEFYRTVACAGCAGGISHEYVFHVTGASGRSTPFAARRDQAHPAGLLMRMPSSAGS